MSHNQSNFFLIKSAIKMKWSSNKTRNPNMTLATLKDKLYE